MKKPSAKILISEAAEIIGCTEDHVRRLVRMGQIKAERLGQVLWLVDRRSALAFAKNRPPIGRPRKKNNEGT
jgi:excisionase family DNA binding protein